jgi:hypothetical protein
VKIVFSTLKKVLFWSYERGSWQYDIMCVLILAFIFFGPNRLFHSHRSATADSAAIKPIVIAASELGQIGPAPVEEALIDFVEKKYPDIEISRVEKVVSATGETKYLVWEKE